MNLLAHDQVWSADDVWTAALVPLMCIPVALIIFAIDPRRDTALFLAMFLGPVMIGAYVVIWGIIGLCWLAGCL